MKTKTIRILFPLWLYEVFLGASHRLGGWDFAWLVFWTVIASISFTFTTS